MSNLNCVVVEGHLVKAAELGYFQNQTAYCNFSIANNESYKKQDGTYENIPSYFDCAMKGKYAEAMHKHLLKGRGIRVVGRLKQQRWEKDGSQHSRIIIKVQEVYLSPLRTDEGGNYSQNSFQQNNQPVSIPADETEFVPFEESEDIPF